MGGRFFEPAQRQPINFLLAEAMRMVTTITAQRIMQVTFTAAIPHAKYGAESTTAAKEPPKNPALVKSEETVPRISGDSSTANVSCEAQAIADPLAKMASATAYSIAVSDTSINAREAAMMAKPSVALRNRPILTTNSPPTLDASRPTNPAAASIIPITSLVMNSGGSDSRFDTKA